MLLHHKPQWVAEPLGQDQQSSQGISSPCALKRPLTYLSMSPGPHGPRPLITLPGVSPATHALVASLARDSSSSSRPQRLRTCPNQTTAPFHTARGQPSHPCTGCKPSGDSSSRRYTSSTTMRPDHTLQAPRHVHYSCRHWWTSAALHNAHCISSIRCKHCQPVEPWIHKMQTLSA
jgi:hypothetical protein